MRDLPVILTEFGGIALARSGAEIWGYSVVATSGRICRALRVPARSGAEPRAAGRLLLYAVHFDTYQEANGLLHGDRTPKMPVDRVASVTHEPPFTVSDVTVKRFF